MARRRRFVSPLNAEFTCITESIPEEFVVGADGDEPDGVLALVIKNRAIITRHVDAPAVDVFAV